MPAVGGQRTAPPFNNTVRQTLIKYDAPSQEKGLVHCACQLFVLLDNNE